MLSFICTVKNGERYLDECIQSVVEHYPDAEFVIVDDGSTDGTPEILKRWAAAEPKIRVITTEGVGRGAALNIAVRASTRRYVANIDADDVALPGREVLISYLESSDDTVAVATGVSIPFWANQTFERSEPQEPPRDPIFRDLQKLLYRTNPISHIAVVVRRNALQVVGGYSEVRLTQLDYDLWVRFKNKGFAIHGASIPVALKRLHREQSFEADNHSEYLIRSLSVRLRACESLKQSVVSIAVLAPTLIASLLPRAIRRKLMENMAVARFVTLLREGSSNNK